MSMNVAATKTKVSAVSVDINPKHVIDKLKQNWMVELFGQNADVIAPDEKGEWWVHNHRRDPHINGLSHTHILHIPVRQITGHEDQVLKAFEKMYEQVELYKKHHG